MLRDARRNGTGLQLQDWHINLDGPDAAAGFAESVIEWCKHTMAASRRPYGVDHFDLALAYRSGGFVRRLSFSRVHVAELYDDALASQILTVLAREVSEARTALVHFSAGLFSWGNALDLALNEGS